MASTSASTKTGAPYCHSHFGTLLFHEGLTLVPKPSFKIGIDAAAVLTIVYENDQREEHSTLNEILE
jgi:hypothetical protein